MKTAAAIIPVTAAAAAIGVSRVTMWAMYRRGECPKPERFDIGYGFEAFQFVEWLKTYSAINKKAN